MKIDRRLQGDLPRNTAGINKGRLDKKAIAKIYGFTHFEVIKAYNCWINIFRYPDSSLTFKEYLDKLVEAKITPSKIGQKSVGGYQLSRIDDIGPYTKERCRFITAHENLAEQKRFNIWNRMIEKYGEEKAREMQREAGKRNKRLPQRSSVRI